MIGDPDRDPMGEARRQAAKRGGLDLVSAFQMPNGTLAVSTVINELRESDRFPAACEAVAAISRVLAEAARGTWSGGPTKDRSTDDVQRDILEYVLEHRRTGGDAPYGVTIICDPSES